MGGPKNEKAKGKDVVQVKPDELKEMINAAVTEAQEGSEAKIAELETAVKEALEASTKQIAQLAEPIHRVHEEDLDEIPFDFSWLEGLTFRGSKVDEIEEDGKTVKKYVPFKRKMAADDVVSWKDYGDHVVIVTADGQKVSVDK